MAAVGRDPDFCKLNIRYAVSVILVSNLLNTLPSWMKPLVIRSVLIDYVLNVCLG